jgi:hypothetical protein
MFDLYEFFLALLTPKHVRSPRAPAVATPPVATPPDFARPPVDAAWYRPPGAAEPGTLPVISRDETFIKVHHADSSNDIPFVPLVGAIPVVGSILTAPIKIGVAISNALGLSKGDIDDFDPWDDPNGDRFEPIQMILRVLDAQMDKYDPVTRRFYNADGTVAVIDTTWTDNTGRLVDDDYARRTELWQKRHRVAKSVNYDRSRVEADGFTLRPPPASPIPYTPEEQAEIDASVAISLQQSETAGENAGGGTWWEGMGQSIS